MFLGLQLQVGTSGGRNPRRAMRFPPALQFAVEILELTQIELGERLRKHPLLEEISREDDGDVADIRADFIVDVRKDGPVVSLNRSEVPAVRFRHDYVRLPRDVATRQAYDPSARRPSGWSAASPIARRHHDPRPPDHRERGPASAVQRRGHRGEGAVQRRGRRPPDDREVPRGPRATVVDAAAQALVRSLPSGVGHPSLAEVLTQELQSSFEGSERSQICGSQARQVDLPGERQLVERGLVGRWASHVARQPLLGSSNVLGRGRRPGAYPKAGATPDRPHQQIRTRQKPGLELTPSQNDGHWKR